MPIPKTELQRLYLVEKQSMHDIAHDLHCSIHKIEYWLKKYNITRRNQSDANYAKYNPKGDPFQIKEYLSLDEERLYSLAIGLYWGEGGKTNYQSARLTNSDPAMIIVYYKFLTTICHIKPTKIHFHLQTFLVHTSKPIPSQGKGNYKKININGVMTVGVYNTHFRAWMMEQLTKLGYNPDITS